MNLATLQLKGTEVYVCSPPAHLDGVDYGVSGYVVDADETGVMLRVRKSQSGGEFDTGQLRFVPWTAVRYVVVEDTPERPAPVSATRPLP